MKEQKIYHKNKKIHKRFFLNERNEIEGELKEFFKDGKTCETMNYKNGLLHGINTSYYKTKEKEDKIYSLKSFHNGEEYGANIYFYKH